MQARKRGREFWLDLGVSLFWSLYAGGYLARSIHQRQVVDVGLLVFYTLVAVAFLRRAPARANGPWWETALALVSVFLPIAVLRPAAGGLKGLGGVVQFVALLGLVLALLSLGRSFAIAPSDRGLVTRGLYRWVRHPLYASEICFYIGYLIANPSGANLAGLLAGTALQLMRIRWEERLLAGYAAYAAKVRWRLFPLIW